MTRRAFTLVELLVAIAVVGVLAALVFPTLERSRESARTAACASNLRQLAAAALFGDFDLSPDGIAALREAIRAGGMRTSISELDL